MGYHWHKVFPKTEQSATTTAKDATSKNSQLRTQDGNEQKLSIKNVDSSETATLDDVTPEQSANQALLNDVMSILKDVYGQDRGAIAAAYNLLMDVSEEDLLANLEYLSRVADDPEYSATLSLFLDRYASLAPNNALNFVLDNITAKQSRQNFVNLALSKWSQQEPELALDWYNGNGEEINHPYNFILSNMFWNLAKKDQELALNHLKDYSENSSNLTRAISGITNSLSDSSEFISLLEKTAYLDSSNARLVKSSPR